jgi:hypothetical protein
MVNSFSSYPDQAFVNVSIGTQDKLTNINFKIDTGSQINCLPNHTFRELKIKHPLEASKARLTSYTGDRLPVRKLWLHCKYNNKSVRSEFYVVEISASPLLSLKTSVDLDLLN